MNYRRILLFSTCIICLACDQMETSLKSRAVKSEMPMILDSVNKEAELSVKVSPKGNYDSLVRSIALQRLEFQGWMQTDQEKAIDSAKVYLETQLLNGVIPHWYGTTWDFNGHTNTPNDGEIACGYFVSTTLKHLGFNLNRYKMAQQAGLIEAQMLQPRSKLKMYSRLSFAALKNAIYSEYKEGIYFVGLDNHVGYVLLKDKEVYFIHSSYCDNSVVIERAEQAPCFQSDFYVFAEITTNRELIKKWIWNTRLAIPRT